VSDSKLFNRRRALAGIAGGLVTSAGLGNRAGAEQIGQGQAPASRPQFLDAVPISGLAGPGLEPIDAAMLKIVDRHGMPGAALAMAKAGKLLLVKCYGWANTVTGEPVQPGTHFGLASLSKTITAVGVLKLVEQKKLRLDDAVLGILDQLKPVGGGPVDPRFGKITVRQCLNHSGGWDRAVTGDPLNWQPQICRSLQASPPLNSVQFLSYILQVPLNFDPGSQASYSNVGYVFLGEVIAKISGQSYERFMSESVLKPMGITSAAMQGFDGKYSTHEAVRHLAGSLTPLPPADLPMINAAGGWSASVVDMIRLLCNLDASHGKPLLNEAMRTVMVEAPPAPIKPRADNTWFGLGWDMAITKGTEFGYYKEGSYQGMRTYMKRSSAGLNWVLLFNASMEFDPHDRDVALNAVREVKQLVEGLEKYPDVDLFNVYR
jgi:CubicO group peptidase (beta-lactamase class C family)